jgi:hypothetical protein
MLVRHRDRIKATQDRRCCLAPVLLMGESIQTVYIPPSKHGRLQRLGRDIVDAFMRDDDPAFVSACMKARAILGPKGRTAISHAFPVR